MAKVGSGNVRFFCQRPDKGELSRIPDTVPVSLG